MNSGKLEHTISMYIKSFSVRLSQKERCVSRVFTAEKRSISRIIGIAIKIVIKKDYNKSKTKTIV